jgi:hypothetical protein
MKQDFATVRRLLWGILSLLWISAASAQVIVDGVGPDGAAPPFATIQAGVNYAFANSIDTVEITSDAAPYDYFDVTTEFPGTTFTLRAAANIHPVLQRAGFSRAAYQFPGKAVLISGLDIRSSDNTALVMGGNVTLRNCKISLSAQTGVAWTIYMADGDAAFASTTRFENCELTGPRGILYSVGKNLIMSGCSVKTTSATVDPALVIQSIQTANDRLVKLDNCRFDCAAGTFQWYKQTGVETGAQFLATNNLFKLGDATPLNQGDFIFSQTMGSDGDVAFIHNTFKDTVNNTQGTVVSFMAGGANKYRFFNNLFDLQATSNQYIIFTYDAADDVVSGDANAYSWLGAAMGFKPYFTQSPAFDAVATPLESTHTYVRDGGLGAVTDATGYPAGDPILVGSRAVATTPATTRDIDGTLRPQGTGSDIGAYELAPAPPLTKVIVNGVGPDASVPPFATIQAGVNYAFANNIDTVEITSDTTPYDYFDVMTEFAGTTFTIKAATGVHPVLQRAGFSRAIYQFTGKTVLIDGLDIRSSDNTALVLGGNVTLRNCKISLSAETGVAWTIYSNDGDPAFAGTARYENCQITGPRGIIYAIGKNLVMSGCTVKTTSTALEPALQLTQTANGRSVTLENCHFDCAATTLQWYKQTGAETGAQFSATNNVFAIGDGTPENKADFQFPQVMGTDGDVAFINNTFKDTVNNAQGPIIAFLAGGAYKYRLFNNLFDLQATTNQFIIFSANAADDVVTADANGFSWLGTGGAFNPYWTQTPDLAAVTPPESNNTYIRDASAGMVTGATGYPSGDPYFVLDRAVATTPAITVDLTGAARTVGTGPDLGAYEFAGFPSAAKSWYLFE